MKKRVYIAYTGGTIGMTQTPDGYAPAYGFLEAQIAAMPELRSDLMPEFDIHEYDPLLDSANMTPAEWLKIAEDIADHYDQFDGFIVLHGTDTMAYTASASPFMLQGLRKPVILTGSQIPLCEVRTDARANMITVMMIAAQFAIPEVCLYFGNQLLRGCRSVKVNADGFDAFASPNYPPLGEIGIGIEINWDVVLPPPDTPDVLQVKALGAATVGARRPSGRCACGRASRRRSSATSCSRRSGDWCWKLTAWATGRPITGSFSMRCGKPRSEA